jgi:hypothetical protein
MQPKPQKGSQGGLTEAWCHAGPPEGPNHRLAPWAPTWQEQGRRCSRRLPVWTFTMRRHSTVEVGRAEVFDSTVPRGPHGNRPREFLRRRRPVTRSLPSPPPAHHDVGCAEQGSSARFIRLELTECHAGNSVRAGVLCQKTMRSVRRSSSRSRLPRRSLRNWSPSWATGASADA